MSLRWSKLSTWQRMFIHPSSQTLVAVMHHISVKGALINAKTKRHLLLLTLTVQIWKVKSVSTPSSSCRPVIQLRDTSGMPWAGAALKQQPLVPSLTCLCAELPAQKASLIKSGRSATAVAIRPLFVYRSCLRSRSSRHAVMGLWGIFSL